MNHKNTNFIAFVLTVDMKRLFIAIGCCLLLLSMGQIFSIGQAQDAGGGTGVEGTGVGSTGVELEQRVFEIARKVRCPVCRAESAADSNATTSIEFRNIIQEKLEEGQSEAEIIAFFQASYGDWILLDPPKRGLHLIVWIAPLVAAILAIGIFLVLLRRWTRKANAAPAVLSAEELAVVQKALESSKFNSDNSLTSKDVSGEQS